MALPGRRSKGVVVLQSCVFLGCRGRILLIDWARPWRGCGVPDGVVLQAWMDMF